MPKYVTPSTKSVKIKPMDRDLFFDGSNMPVDKFIKRYEISGSADGASPKDLCLQVIFFLKGSDLKDEVEAMTGYEDSNWETLKEQLLTRFGSSLPLVKYTEEDLRKLVEGSVQTGGISTLQEFKCFRTKFETITHYLVRLGYYTCQLATMAEPL